MHASRTCRQSTLCDALLRQVGNLTFEYGNSEFPDVVAKKKFCTVSKLKQANFHSPRDSGNSFTRVNSQ